MEYTFEIGDRVFSEIHGYGSVVGRDGFVVPYPYEIYSVQFDKREDVLPRGVDMIVAAAEYRPAVVDFKLVLIPDGEPRRLHKGDIFNWRLGNDESSSFDIWREDSPSEGKYQTYKVDDVKEVNHER